MKVDVEGHECKVLRGGRNFFEHFKEQIVFVQTEMWRTRSWCVPVFRLAMERIGLRNAPELVLQAGREGGDFVDDDYAFVRDS